MVKLQACGEGRKKKRCLMHVLCSLLSCSVLSDSANPWTVALQAPPSMGFSGKNTGVGCHFLLQGIFSTQGSNPGLLHCMRILYHEPLGKDLMHIKIKSETFRTQQLTLNTLLYNQKTGENRNNQTMGNRQCRITTCKRGQTNELI